LTPDEVAQVLRRLSGISWIMGPLLYGAGLRLWVKDLDFAYNQIVVRDGKGQKDRVTISALLRSACASGGGSPRAFGVLVCLFNRQAAKTLGLTITPEGLYQTNQLIH